MEWKLNKKDLFNAIGTVSTQSGPVVPAKSKTIETMTKGILKPLKGGQDSEKWDRRKYDANPNLCMGNKFIGLDDIVRKVMTESVSKTGNPGFRLNLQSIDSDAAHCKFVTQRDGQNVTIELFYPNENDQISVRLTTQDGASNVYAVDPNSDVFNGNFGYSIIKSADELIKSSVDSHYDDMLDASFTTSLGNDLGSLDNTLVQPSALMRESVDWHLDALRKICLEADDDQGGAPEAAPDQGAGFTESDFNAPMELPGDVNAGGDAAPGDTEEEGDDSMMFRDYAEQKFSTTMDGIFDKLAKIVADREYRAIQDSSSGIKPSRNDIENGYAGVSSQTPHAILDAFLKCFPDLDSMPLPVAELDSMAEYLENNYDSASEFIAKLGEFFPETYDKNGDAKQVQLDMDTLSDLPGEYNQTSEPNMDGQIDYDSAPTDFGNFIDQANNEFGSSTDMTEPGGLDDDETIGADALPEIF